MHLTPLHLQRGLLILTIGLSIGLVEFVITSSLAWLNHEKLKYLRVLSLTLEQYKVMFVVVPVITLLSFVVVYFAPQSAGSSLPEVKGHLAGTKIPRIFGYVTTTVKAVGVILVIVAGYPVGREGPMIQVGCAIAHKFVRYDFWTDLLAGGEGSGGGGRRGSSSNSSHSSSSSSTPTTHPLKRLDLKSERVLAEQTMMIIVGGCAGIAAAFRSPIGGVLYMIEDYSTFWNRDATLRAFACALVATLFFSLCVDGVETLNYAPLVMYEQVPEVIQWHTKDLPFFGLLALLGGLMSVLYSESLIFFSKLRRLRRNFKTPPFRILEVCLFTIIICTIPLYLPSAFPCRVVPAASTGVNNVCISTSCNVCAACCHDFLAGDQGVCDACVGQLCTEHNPFDSEELVRYDCPDGMYNEMASLYHLGAEGAIKQLYSREEAKKNLFSKKVLTCLLFVYFSLACLTSGLQIPFGTFVPNLFMGATLGRLFGLVSQDSFGVKGLSSPGAFALVGAASMLGGYTRMSIAIVAIIAESSGDVSMVIPLMLAVLIGGYAAGFLSEPFDEKMMELRLIPFLRDSLTHETDRRLETAGSVMIACPTILEREKLSTLKHLLDSASNSDYMALPVVGASGQLLGLVSGEGIKRVIAEHSFEAFTSGRASLDSTPVRSSSLDLAPGSVGAGVVETFVDMSSVMDPSPYTVLDNFPLSRLYPIFSKLKVENCVVQDHSGKAVGVVHKTCLIESNLDYMDNSDFAKVSKLQYNGGGSGAASKRSSKDGKGLQLTSASASLVTSSGRSTFSLGSLRKLSGAPKPLAEREEELIDTNSFAI